MIFVNSMKITPMNNAFCSFQARKPEIRKADDIQRRAKHEFPLLSTTYIDMFYKCVNKANPDTRKQERADYIASKLDKKITSTRNSSAPQKDCIDSYIPYARTLQSIKKTKVGNCAEFSASVIAALAANGIYDSQMSNLGLSIDFRNKKTGKSEYKVIEPIDHSLVVTALDKKNPKDKDFIAIDSWLGFTDSLSGAKEKYKKIYNDEFMSPEIKMHRSLFRLDKFEKTKTMINYDDYDISTKIVIYKAPDKYDRNSLSDLGAYCRRKFPDLILNTGKKNSSLKDLLQYMSYLCRIEQL